MYQIEMKECVGARVACVPMGQERTIDWNVLNGSAARDAQYMGERAL